MYLIWSIEHNAWWKDQERGYTPNRDEAGIYECDHAHEIVDRANINENNTPNEALVPVQVCMTCMNKKVVQEGQHDDIRDVPCPDCVDTEEADMTGATNTGDR